MEWVGSGVVLVDVLADRLARHVITKGIDRDAAVLTIDEIAEAVGYAATDEPTAEGFVEMVDAHARRMAAGGRCWRATVQRWRCETVVLDVFDVDSAEVAARQIESGTSDVQTIRAVVDAEGSVVKSITPTPADGSAGVRP